MEDQPGKQDGHGRIQSCQYGDNGKLSGTSGGKVKQIGDTSYHPRSHPEAPCGVPVLRTADNGATTLIRATARPR
jgi:hypothetical protein